MKKLSLFLILISMFCFCDSCKKKPKAPIDSVKINVTKDQIKFDAAINEMADENDVPMLPPDKLKDSILKIAVSELTPPPRKVKKADYTISKKYLDDKIVYKNLDSKKWEGKKIGVVATTGVKLYEKINGEGPICDVPKGSVVEVLEEMKNTVKQEDEELPDVFNWNNEVNYWYKVDFNGKTGHVFGSYLVMTGSEEAYSLAARAEINADFKVNDSPNEAVLKLAYSYTRPEVSPDFSAFTGRTNPAASRLAEIEKTKISFEAVSPNDYVLSVDSPDDMLSLYKSDSTDMMKTVFVTTDLYVHSLHLVFNRMLEDTESSSFYPILANLTSGYYARLSEMEKGSNGDELKKSITMMKKYFLVAGDLLGVKLADKSQYPEDVSKELALIDSASGFDESPVFGYKEDYSQFKPRGHYTKSERLKRYFKAMIWYGRLHFYCVTDSKDEKIIKNSIALTRSALLLVKIAKEDPGLFAMWKALFAPITYVVGETDDYNLVQYLSISQDVDFEDFNDWIESEGNIKKFMKTADSKLKPPKISGNILKQDDDPAKFSPRAPSGFRLFGQRFTLDSYIHGMLSAPRINSRTMVSGADVMSAFGNVYASNLMKAESEKYPGYDKNIKALREAVGKMDDDSWRTSFYNSYLRTIRELSLFGKGSGFFFTADEQWDKKTLQTGLAAWAELRHDTILYVKQNYAEMGDGGPEVTWKIDRIKRPTGYIEPNLGALYWMEIAVDDIVSCLSDTGLMKESYVKKFSEFKKILSRSIEIAELEAADKKISDEQNEFIYGITNSLCDIVLPDNAGSYIDSNELKMALVADVHTDAENGVVLEVATGVPSRVYVALNDGSGGKRLAVGYVYSYYEFTQPMNNRLNDEEWKKMVYESAAGVEGLRPAWLKGVVTK